MKLSDHLCESFEPDDDGLWVARCMCGFMTAPIPDADIAVDVFTSHVAMLFAIERPPADVIEDARRAFDSRRGR